jgi:transcriptional regulator with PAS, ATPase and Fis domain
LLEQLGQEIEYQRAIIDKYQKEAGNTLRQESQALVFSTKMQRVIELATRLAGVDTTVLITGETGVGKEVVARTLHSAGPRKDLPFFIINCAAIPETLIESELFGYEAGAFTGAHTKGKLGVFELASKGTLFFDEIDEMPMTMQAKLLRAMQSKEIMRVGGKSIIKVNVRIIAATNRPLEDLVQQGQFRDDLYYRLSVAKIDIPPLRERIEAVEPLAELFLGRFNAKHRRKSYFSPAALEVLRNYDWPGNVRQLENVIESLVIACANDEINPCDLPVTLSRKNYDILAASTFMGLATNKMQSLKGMMDDVEKLLLDHFLQLYQNDIYRLASELQCDRSTLQRKLRKHKIQISRRRNDQNT